MIKIKLSRPLTADEREELETCAAEMESRLKNAMEAMVAALRAQLKAQELVIEWSELQTKAKEALDVKAMAKASDLGQLLPIANGKAEEAEKVAAHAKQLFSGYLHTAQGHMSRILLPLLDVNLSWEIRKAFAPFYEEEHLLESAIKATRARQRLHFRYSGNFIPPSADWETAESRGEELAERVKNALSNDVVWTFTGLDQPEDEEAAEELQGASQSA